MKTRENKGGEENIPMGLWGRKRARPRHCPATQRPEKKKKNICMGAEERSKKSF